MKALAVATESFAAEAANRILKENGTATEAAIAGFLAAAATRPGALFGSLQLLLAGPGVGARAFDGRPRQPGQAAPRPRGFVEGEPIPDAAWVAVPASLSAIALAHAYDGQLALSRLARPAVEVARAEGRLERERVFKRIGAVGAGALREALVARPLLAVAARSQGGLLTEEDLAAVRPESGAPIEIALASGTGEGGEPIRGSRKALVVPWALSAERRHRVAEVIAVADVRAVVAALAYEPDDEGIAIPELELSAPRDAVVVRRGITRVRPGEPLPSPAPIAILVEQAQPFLALGIAADRPLTAEPELIAAWGQASPAGAMLRAAGDAVRGERGVGVVRAERGEMAGVSLLGR